MQVSRVDSFLSPTRFLVVQREVLKFLGSSPKSARFSGSSRTFFYLWRDCLASGQIFVDEAKIFQIALRQIFGSLVQVSRVDLFLSSMGFLVVKREIL